MKSLQDLLSKLDRVKFNEIEEHFKHMKGELSSGQPIEIKLITKVSTTRINNQMNQLAFDMTLHVLIDGQNVSFWGCESLEEQLTLSRWIQEKEAEIRLEECENSRKKHQIAKQLWDLI